jgi:hypothetical protein
MPLFEAIHLNATADVADHEGEHRLSIRCDGAEHCQLSDSTGLRLGQTHEDT